MGDYWTVHTLLRIFTDLSVLHSTSRIDASVARLLMIIHCIMVRGVIITGKNINKFFPYIVVDSLAYYG